MAPPRRLPARAARVLAALLGLALVAPADAAEWKAAQAEFETAQKNPDWKERKDAYLRLQDHDRPEAVAAILGALERETNGAVVLAGVEAMARMRSDGARAALVAAARKGPGDARLHVLVALERQDGADLDALYLETLKGTDSRAAAQAALAVGAKRRPGAVEALIPLLKHAEWQVRAAAARSLGRLGATEALPALAAALDVAHGRDRTDVLRALAAVGKPDFGADVAAWKALAAGGDAASIPRAPAPLPPTFFGIPIRGERVVVCLDNSLRMRLGHGYTPDRLQAITETKEGKPIERADVYSYGSLGAAHVKHLVDGMRKGSKVEVLTFNGTVTPLLGKLSPVVPATKKAIESALNTLTADEGIATFTVLNQALDTPGAAAAWKSGPDEIVFVTVNNPTKGEVTDATAIATAIGLKARLRMVTVHTVGLGLHPFEMCRQIAERTGGTYLDLTK